MTQALPAQAGWRDESIPCPVPRKPGKPRASAQISFGKRGEFVSRDWGGEGDPIARRGSKPEAPNPGRNPRELIPKPASHPRCQRLRAALEVQSPAVSVRGLLRTSASAQNTCSCPKSHTPSSGRVPQPQQLVQHCSHLLPAQLPRGWIPGNGSVLSH